MTHALSPHGDHGATAVGQIHFPPAEWASFQAEDLGSAKVIICLMTAIFTTGLVLYSIVALTIAY